MLKKRVSPFYRALPLGLLLCFLVGVTPVLGQIRPDSLETLTEQFADRFFPHRINDDYRLSLLIGTCFHAERSSEFCPLVQMDFRWMFTPSSNDGPGSSNFLPFQPGLFRPLMTDHDAGMAGFGLQGTGSYSSSDTWPDPPPPGGGMQSNAPRHSAKTGEGAAMAQEEQLKANHKGTITITPLELLVAIPIQPRILVEPFVGIGFATISEGTPKPFDYAIEGKTMFAASYGVGLTIRLGEVSDMGPVDLRFLFRGNVYFAGDLTYIPLEDEPFRHDVGTISTSNILFGIGYRFPK